LLFVPYFFYPRSRTLWVNEKWKKGGIMKKLILILLSSIAIVGTLATSFELDARRHGGHRRGGRGWRRGGFGYGPGIGFTVGTPVYSDYYDGYYGDGYYTDGYYRRYRRRPRVGVGFSFGSGGWGW